MKILSGKMINVESDKAALLVEHIYNLHGDDMLGRALCITNDYQSSEEIIQDSFLKLYYYLCRNKLDGRLLGWLKRVVTNAAIDVWRKSRHAVTTIPIEWIAETEILNASTQEEKDLHRFMLKWLSRLPHRKREIFEMRAGHGMSYRDISDAIGCSVCAAEKIYQRLRNQLEVDVRRVFYVPPVKYKRVASRR